LSTKELIKQFIGQAVLFQSEDPVVKVLGILTWIALVIAAVAFAVLIYTASA